MEAKKRQRGSTLGIYFPGLSKQEANAVRTRVNEVAAKLGVLAERGATAGNGATGRLLIAIANGDVVVSRRLSQGESETREAVAASR
jgi:hypothetical protein